MANEYDFSCEEGVCGPLTEEEMRACCDLVLAEEGVERPCMVSISLVSAPAAFHAFHLASSSSAMGCCAGRISP